MRIGALLGWGIGIYAVMTLVASGFVIYGIADTLLARILGLAVLLVLATIAGRSLRLHNWFDVLPYSFFWAVVAACLDSVYVVPFSGWAIYSDWNIWLGYGLLVVVPLMAPMTDRKAEIDRS